MPERRDRAVEVTRASAKNAEVVRCGVERGIDSQRSRVAIDCRCRSPELLLGIGERLEKERVAGVRSDRAVGRGERRGAVAEFGLGDGLVVVERLGPEDRDRRVGREQRPARPRDLVVRDCGGEVSAPEKQIACLDLGVVRDQRPRVRADRILLGAPEAPLETGPECAQRRRLAARLARGADDHRERILPCAREHPQRFRRAASALQRGPAIEQRLYADRVLGVVVAGVGRSDLEVALRSIGVAAQIGDFATLHPGARAVGRDRRPASRRERRAVQFPEAPLEVLLRIE